MKSLIKLALFSLVCAQTILIAPPPGVEVESALESENLLSCGGCRE